MQSNDGNSDFPQQMKIPVRKLHQSLEELKKLLNEFNSNYTAIKREANTALEKAKLDLTVAYANNSLFWIYLCTKGVDPREHNIKQELNRLKNYMQRLKEIEDKSSAAKLDVSAAKRFVRNALWDHNNDHNNDSTDNGQQRVKSDTNVERNNLPPKKKTKFK